jgi:pantothenate synthetase
VEARVVCALSLPNDLDGVEGKALIALAVFIGKTRLIDNVILKEALS